MSLLTQSALTPAQDRAVKIQTNAQSFRNAIIGEMRHGVGLWSSNYEENFATSQALGLQKTAEIFALFAGFAGGVRAILVQFADADGVASVDAIIAQVPAHSIGADGIITLTPPPAPDPEP